ncbi:MAG: hypothetical protein U0792_00570 [Gemmataceae bacterium]
MTEYLSLGEVAREVRVLETPLRRLCTRHPDKIPHGRAGRARIFRREDLPAIRAACIEAGLLQRETEVAAHAQ